MSSGHNHTGLLAFGVVMAGGRGKRFWPLSRANKAKHLLPVVGGKTLLEVTIERLLPILGQARILVVTQSCQVETTKQALRRFLDVEILIEPVGKNTAACIALATAHLLRCHNDCVVAFMPADHFIEKPDGFRGALLNAMDFAWKGGVIVTLGVRPTRVATGFGYIEMGEILGRSDDHTFYRVTRFTEKPDQSKAKEFVESGRYLWNAGIFISKASVMMDEIRKWLPKTAAQFDRYIKAEDAERSLILEQAYSALDEISIDFGVIEKSEIVAVLPVDIGWDDVGSWESYARHLAQDEFGNRFYGTHIGVETSNSIIYTDAAAVATLGIKDIIVIVTGDSVLIADRRKSEEVRRIVDIIEKKGLTHLL